jgi:hypothetical protein
MPIQKVCKFDQKGGKLCDSLELSIKSSKEIAKTVSLLKTGSKELGWKE